MSAFSPTKKIIFIVLLVTFLRINLSARPYREMKLPRSESELKWPAVDIGKFQHYQPGTIVIKFTREFVNRSIQPSPSAIKKSHHPLRQVLQKYGVHHLKLAFPNAKTPERTDRVDLSRIYKISFSPNYDARRVAWEFEELPGVEYAEPLQLHQLCFVPNDPEYPQQWHLQTIQAEKAWDLHRGDSTVIIGIVDTGVDWQHPDLAGKLWINRDEIPENGIDDDQNGFIDDIRGWDFGESDPSVKNTSSQIGPAHGSHTAGIAAAATHNGIGIASIGFNCKIMAVKCSRDYENDSQQFIDSGFEGIKYAVDNGADIVSCSWSGEGASNYEFDLIQYAHERGVAIVAAAGNARTEQGDYPASYPYVFSVAATDQFDQKAGISNYHATVDICAPGVDIRSIWAGTEDYFNNDGTSMATPLVAGAAALVKAAHPEWTGEQAIYQVRQTADDIYQTNARYFQKLGKGRLNAFRALKDRVPAIRLEQVVFSDSAGGDQDGNIEARETIELIVTVKNYLIDATNVKLTLFTRDPYVYIKSRYANFAEIAMNEIKTTAETPFQLEIDTGIPYGHEIDFLLDIEADDGYEDWDNFSLLAANLYATHDIGNVAFTITSFGALGYYDYVNSEKTIGEGFQYPKGSPSALFHGSFMVGTGPLQVSDCAYGNVQNNRYDWQMAVDGNLSFSSLVSDQDGWAQYHDSSATSPIGVIITQKSYAWTNMPDDDFVILEYHIQNSSSDRFETVYAGLYMDWDIDESTRNIADYEPEVNLGFEYAHGSNYYGIAALHPDTVAAYRAINNEDYIWTNAFTDKLKWQYMVGGFKLTKSDEINDWSQLMAVGPFALDRNETKVVTFAVLGGDDKNDLIANVKAARQKYFKSTGGVKAAGQSLDQYALLTNYPNPFNQSTMIRYTIPARTEVKIMVFNVNGQKVKGLVNQMHDSGNYRLLWNGKNDAGIAVPSGVYFLQMQSGQFIQTQKVVLVR